MSAGVKALKKMNPNLNGLQAKNNTYGGAYGMASFGVPLGATGYYSTSMPIAVAAPVRWQPPVKLAPSQPSASQLLMVWCTSAASPITDASSSTTSATPPPCS